MKIYENKKIPVFFVLTHLKSLIDNIRNEGSYEFERKEKLDNEILERLNAICSNFVRKIKEMCDFFGI